MARRPRGLLTNVRAKIEAVIEWASNYFGGARSNPILDRIEQTQIDLEPSR